MAFLVANTNSDYHRFYGGYWDKDRNKYVRYGTTSAGIWGHSSGLTRGLS